MTRTLPKETVVAHSHDTYF